jgi:hypothetical protein
MKGGPMKRLSLLLILCFMMVSCAGGLARPIQRAVVFNDDEYLPYRKPGKAVITGQAFTTTRSGEIRYGAGRTVSLHPATTYAAEYFNVQVVRGAYMSEPDPRFLQFEKTTISDATGTFEFKNLPAGKYYVVTDFSWCAGRSPQYVILGTLIQAMAGETTRVIPPVVRSPIIYEKRISCY